MYKADNFKIKRNLKLNRQALGLFVIGRKLRFKLILDPKLLHPKLPKPAISVLNFPIQSFLSILPF
jgi:hypothetical protein